LHDSRKQLNAPICIVAPLFWIAKNQFNGNWYKNFKNPKKRLFKETFQIFQEHPRVREKGRFEYANDNWKSARFN